MIPAIAKLKLRFSNWHEYELNPVLVKELRQSVRSRTATYLLLMLLVVLFFLTVFILTIGNLNEGPRLSGASVWPIYLFLLALVGVIYIPLHVGTRLAAERNPANLELLYASTLTPGKIIRGKFLAGAYLALLFFSACTPFLALTYLLRGVDLPTIFLALLNMYVIACVAIMIAIFVACLPINKAFKSGLALLLMWNGLSLVGPLVLLGSFYPGVRPIMFIKPELSLEFITIAGVVLAFMGLLYFASVALITPKSKNRALPLRVYITSVWVLGAAISLIWAHREHDVELILPWTYATFFLMGLGLLVLISQNDTLSRRVRGDIPPGGIKRVLAFLFFNGAAGGLIWAMLILGLTFAFTTILLLSSPAWLGVRGSMSPEEAQEFIVRSGAALAYWLGYTLTGLFLHRKFFPKSSPKTAVGMVAVILAVDALLPYAIYIIMGELSNAPLDRVYLGNVFDALFVEHELQLNKHLTFAIAWLCLGILLNLKWFIVQARNFRPIERPVESTVQQPTPPPAMKEA